MKTIGHEKISQEIIDSFMAFLNKNYWPDQVRAILENAELSKEGSVITANYGNGAIDTFDIVESVSFKSGYSHGQ